MDYVPSKTFFKDVSIRASYVDIDSVKKIYYAMLKTILADIRKNDKITLPDFGRFSLTDLSPRVSPGLHGGPKQNWPAMRVIRFRPCTKLRDYFKDRFKNKV
jgi:nucleoid DNA-binding protein